MYSSSRVKYHPSHVTYDLYVVTLILVQECKQNSSNLVSEAVGLQDNDSPSYRQLDGHAAVGAAESLLSIPRQTLLYRFSSSYLYQRPCETKILPVAFHLPTTFSIIMLTRIDQFSYLHSSKGFHASVPFRFHGLRMCRYCAD